MFGTYLKQSLRTLPFIVLFSVGTYVLSRFLFEEYYLVSLAVVDSLFIDFYSDYGRIGFIGSLVINPLLLLIVPALFGGNDPRKKRAEFYTGFFMDLTLMFVIPIFLFFKFQLDGLTITLLVGLHALYLLVPFILGALFVSPSYRRAFWFAQR